MNTYLYLSVMPETLVSSMLPPKEYGTYLAVGSQQKLPRETMFFSLKPDFRNDKFDFSLIEKGCIPHSDGRPKKSLYLGIYRVLENIPLSAIENLYLVTRDGRVLELHKGVLPEVKVEEKCHLYTEICPTTPLVISSLSPTDYCSFITGPGHALYIPKICFMEMEMPDLSENRPCGSLSSISDHVIETHKALADGNKKVKIVDRRYQISGLGRGIKGGFYLGDKEDLLFFPFPSHSELEKNYHEWYRSANL
jgi:hypothetical protein